MACTDCDNGFTGPWWRYPPLRNALLAGVIALSAWLLMLAGTIDTALETALYWLAIPLGGYLWAREGLEELFEEHEVGISLLMIAATAGSGILGLWEEAAALVVLYGAAEGIEEYTFARTRTAIRALLDLAPKEARVLRDGEEITVPAESLQPGEHFVVRPGESLPTDGLIISGESGLDESPVTGESIPVDKGPGDPVFAASINGQGMLTIEVTAGFADNTLSRIIHLVEEAQDQKGRAQQWMERFGRRYSPAVLATSALFLLVPWLGWGDSATWAERAVILLVAAAPCALVISLPITMAAGIAGAGRRGILIKGGAHLEHLGIIHTIAFDKTGTLTHGKPRVTDVTVLNGKEEELLAVAGGLESSSGHPLARAIVDYVGARGISALPPGDFVSLTGSGVQAEINGVLLYLGKPDLFRDLGLPLAEIETRLNELQADGKTVVLVGSGKQVTGLIALQDTLRDDARDVIARLHDMDIRTVMLTGDNRRTAERVAAQLGIDDVRADLKPEDKVSAVTALLNDGPVLMVGDGVNDAPALAAATCGVAMGAAGTDAAIEAADIALMADDLDKLEEALQLGRRARRISLQNIVFAILVLAILIPAGVGGFISIAVAVLAHEASELLAVANGLRAAKH
ncbi:MAG TPA: cation-translocating P-type ATPase [Gammaproteobacteria bacterium]|nr:cation-translocating P-type ATPase [Gammaproteobacteria bacterium]